MPVFRFKVMTLKDKTRARKGPATNKGKQEQTIIEKNAFPQNCEKLIIGACELHASLGSMKEKY